MRYSELYISSLNKIGDREKAIDIQVLMEKAFRLSRTQYWSRKDEKIEDKTRLKKFYRDLDRLMRHEPTAYIIKEKEFYSEKFYVNRNVLIPRPETEILVERAIQSIRHPARVLDIGAGSGIVSIILARETKSRVMALEKSKKALYVLKKNIRFHRVEDRVFPCRADLFPRQGQKFDLIVSNPPYLSDKDWQRLPPGIRCYEPREALAAGEEGTEIIAKIIGEAKKFLHSPGLILAEIGHGQKAAVERMLKESGFSRIDFFDDYSHIPRVACGGV